MKCDVVFIDTGCDISHPRLLQSKITNLQLVNNDADNYELLQINRNNDDVGHGTALCNIVCMHCPDASIIMIKLFDNSLLVSERQLLYVLHYVLTNIQCKIVNLSLGISVLEYYEEMYRLCEKLDKKGIVIISAFDNDGSVSFPAAMDNVIGVTSGENCKKNTDYYLHENKMVNISAKGNIQRIAWLNGKYSVGKGNSYACAHVTGISLCLMKAYKVNNRENLLMCMKDNKESYTYYNDDFNSADHIKQMVTQYKRVAVFPFNKEIHALIRFQELLPFEIIDVFDTKFSVNIGVSTDKLLNIKSNKSFVIKNINDIDWNTIDTLVIGHTFQLTNSQLMDRTQLIRLLSEAELYKKNVFSFDVLPSSFQNNEKFVTPPTFDNHEIIPFGKLYHQDKPVLAVFGTSSKQGKFSLQLTIREKLLQRGYMVGQLGTEPSSFLFGMDECFHFGYNSEMRISGFERVSVLNKLMYNIAQNNVDIIITGCQSETILTAEGNLFNYPLPQIEFLFGILPDAVILVVNPYDDLEIIQRTINFLETCVECKVIAIVVYPMDINRENLFMQKRHMEQEDYDTLKKSVENLLKRPCFDMDCGQSINSLIDLVEKTFS